MMREMCFYVCHFSCILIRFSSHTLLEIRQMQSPWWCSFPHPHTHTHTKWTKPCYPISWGAFRRTEVSEIEIPQPIHHRGTTPAGNNLSRQLQRAAAGWVGWNCWFHLRGILCSSWLRIIHVVPAWYSWQIAVISSFYDNILCSMELPL